MMLLSESIALLSQAAPDRVVRIGELAGSLTDADLARIERIAHDNCGRLWLVQQRTRQFLFAYCAPEFEQGRLRKDGMLPLARFEQRPWGLFAQTARYAQVAVGERAVDRPPAGDRDPGRPFFVNANAALTDFDLVSVVAFIRSGPKPPPSSDSGAPIEKDWPIAWIARVSHGALTVALLRDELSGQMVEVRKGDRGWEVVTVRFYIE
jgi:hypothetical protein